MERPHEYAPIEWIELTEDKIPLSSLSGMDKVESDSKGTISIISLQNGVLIAIMKLKRF